MGTQFVLVVKDENQTEAVVRAYFQHYLDKERAIRGKESNQEVEDYWLYQNTRDRLLEEGKFYISEPLYSDVADAMGWDDVRDLFDLEKSIRNPTISDSEDVEQLIDLLRDAKEPLQSEQPDVNWELTLELQAIALCEFALEHGYGIKLSLG